MLIRLLIILSLATLPLKAQSQERCSEVHLADIGWTDVTSTTAIAAELLRALKYTPRISVLSTPVTLAGLKNGDVDVFLGNWMPTQEADVRPYLDQASVVQLTQNLSGARFTLAVPKYVHDAGVKTFADIANFKKKFGGRIYGIEAGNDGNRLILGMIANNTFGLKGWRLVESSEQGMLAEVSQRIKQKEWIVFLAWAPHPMNITHELAYLDGGDQIFGKNFGESAVYTLTRRNLAADCPALGHFFQKLAFSIDIENEVMKLILLDKMPPAQAAQTWLAAHADLARAWLKEIPAADGSDAIAAFDSYLNELISGTTHPTAWRLPLGDLMADGVLFLTGNFSTQFRALSHGVESVIKKTLALLLKVPWPMLIGLICAAVFVIQRRLSLVAMVLLGLLLIVNLGLWRETLQTLVLVLYAAATSSLLGIPLGIWAAHHPKLDKLLRPLLDLMQTIPTFVYLIPTLMLFGLGLVPGLISTVIFAVAAPIRLTALGIKSVPPHLLESADAFGATRLQRLIKVEIPAAFPSIMAGLNQCIMLSLSMVVIAALVGADGLGTPVVRALNTVNIKQGFEAGLAIVILAILLDRTLQRRLR